MPATECVHGPLVAAAQGCLHVLAAALCLALPQP